MTVSADAEKLNINTSGIPYKLIIGAALLIDIIGVAVQEMHIFFFYISIIKKLNVHKCVIAVFVVFGQSHIFIKVKSFDIFKTYKSVFILLANIFGVAVLMDGTVKTYNVTPSTADPTSAALTSTDPYYWTNHNDITVTAWWGRPRRLLNLLIQPVTLSGCIGFPSS